MKKLLTLAAFAFLLWMVTFVSCKKELSLEDYNQPPVANAGADQKITLPKDSILLEFVQIATKNDAVIKLMKDEFKNIEVVRGGSVGIESISMMER